MLSPSTVFLRCPSGGTSTGSDRMVPWGSQGLALGSCSLAAACLPALTAFLPPPGGCDRTARLPSPSQSPELTVRLCPSYPRAQASHPLLLSLGASASVQQSCAGGSHEDLFSAAPGPRGLSPCLTSPFPPSTSPLTGPLEPKVPVFWVLAPAQWHLPWCIRVHGNPG